MSMKGGEHVFYILLDQAEIVPVVSARPQMPHREYALIVTDYIWSAASIFGISNSQLFMQFLCWLFGLHEARGHFCMFGRQRSSSLALQIGVYAMHLHQATRPNVSAKRASCRSGKTPLFIIMGIAHGSRLTAHGPWPMAHRYRPKQSEPTQI